MKIEHNIALWVDQKKIKQDFAELGIELEEGFTSFKITEADEMWPQVSKLAEQYDAIDTIETKFTAKELKSAKNLKMSSTWHHGYPEPSDDFGYIDQVYDLSDYCSECGTGKSQKAPFKMKGEPKWGAKGITQLNWVFDEFFVKPEVWETVFRPFGVECKEVLHARSDKILETVVQLVIPDSTVSFELTNYPLETCPKCKADKYIPITRGYFPPLSNPNDAEIFRPQAYFGSGGGSFRAVVISQELYLSILSNKLKGVSFTPLQM